MSSAYWGILWRVYLTALVVLVIAIIASVVPQLYKSYQGSRNQKALMSYIDKLPDGDWKRTPVPFPFEPEKILSEPIKPILREAKDGSVYQQVGQDKWILVEPKPKFDPNKPYTRVNEKFDPDKYLQDFKDRESLCLAGLMMYSGFINECFSSGEIKRDDFPKELKNLGLYPDSFIGSWPRDWSVTYILLSLLAALLFIRYWGPWIFQGKRPNSFP